MWTPNITLNTPFRRGKNWHITFLYFYTNWNGMYEKSSTLSFLKFCDKIYSFVRFSVSKTMASAIISRILSPKINIIRGQVSTVLSFFLWSFVTCFRVIVWQIYIDIRSEERWQNSGHLHYSGGPLTLDKTFVVPKYVTKWPLSLILSPRKKNVLSRNFKRHDLSFILSRHDCQIRVE